MPQPIYFYNSSSGLKIPRVDSDGHIILSPTTTINAVVSGLTVSVNITQYTEDTLAAQGVGTIALAKYTGDTVSAMQLLPLTNSRPLVTALVDSNGDQISSFGGGQQYVESTVSAAPTGNVLFGKQASNTLSAIQLDASKNLKVAVIDSTLPTGAATSANQTTIIGHVDGIEGILNSISAAFVGNQVQVTASSLPLPTGAATSAKQDVISAYLSTLAACVVGTQLNVTISSSGVGTEYVESTVSALPTGTVIFGKQASNSLSSLQLDANKYLRVNVSDSTLPSGAATSANQSTIIGHVDGIETILTSISAAFVGTQVQVTASSLPLPTGAATSAKQDTIIGHLDGVEGFLGTISSAFYSQNATASSAFGVLGFGIQTGTTVAAFQLDANKYLRVNVTDSTLPSGAATAANQTTANGYLGTLAAAVSGTEMQVDVVGALPTGNNVIGQVKITDGTTIADVSALANSNAIHVYVTDAVGNQVTSFGGSNTQYTEDVAGITDPVGTFPLFIRQDTPAGIVSTDGDAIAGRATNYGAQYVQVLNSSGSFVDTFGGGQQYVESTISALPTGTVILGKQASNSLAALQLDANKYLRVNVTDSTLPTGAATSAKQDIISGYLSTLAACVVGTQLNVTIGSAGGTQYSELAATTTAIGTLNLGKLNQNTLAAMQLFSLTSSRPLVAAIVDGSGTQITSFGGGGTQYVELTVSASATGTIALAKQASNTISSLQLNASKDLLVAVNAAIPAGTNTIGSVLISNTTLTSIGMIAHDGADTTTNYPIKQGFRAKNLGSLPTAVADADVAHGVSDRYGSQFVVQGSTYIRTINADYTSAQTNVAIITAAANESIRIYTLIVSLDYDAQIAPSIYIGFGSASTPTTSGVLFANGGLVPGFYPIHYTAPPFGASGEDLRITSDAITNGTISVIVVYDVVAI